MPSAVLPCRSRCCFSGKVRDNLCYGNPDTPEDDMIAAAKAADAHSFVSAIPEGYDAAVARRGTNFSGGQRQRLAIARSLTTKPKILILDDSTSALDMSTEARVQDAIQDLVGSSTTIFVAQRISTVITADRIFLMEAGEIIAAGTHEELLKNQSSIPGNLQFPAGRSHRMKPLLRRHPPSREPQSAQAVPRSETFGRLMGYVAHYRGALFWVVLAALLNTGLNLAVTYFLGQGINNLVGPRDLDLFRQTALIMLLCGVFGCLALLVQGCCWRKFTQRSIYDLRRQLFNHVMTLSLNFFRVAAPSAN